MFFDWFGDGIVSVFDWLAQMKFYDIPLTMVAILALLASLVWRYVLAPIFGTATSDKAKYRKNKNSSNDSEGD